MTTAVLPPLILGVFLITAGVIFFIAAYKGFYKNDGIHAENGCGLGIFALLLFAAAYYLISLALYPVKL